MNEITYKPEDCRRFEECSAPLCPLDGDLHQRVWFADEPICRSKDHGSGRQWIVSQKKIMKKSTDKDTCYTPEMLDRKFIVKKGIVGVDPDSKDFPAAVRKWIQQRKEIVPGQTEIKQLRARIWRKKQLSEQGLNVMT